MNKHLIVKQNGYKTCASACLLSIMRYYGLDTSLDQVAYILKTNSEGTNALNIINGSRTFGFDGYGIHYSYEDIINNNVSLPIICHVKKDNYFHFIVVYKINKKNIEIMDPSSNITKMNKSIFKSIYLNTSIVIYPIKEINKISNNKILNIIYSYIIIYKDLIIKVLFYSIITTFFGIISNYYLLILIDYFIPIKDELLLIVISIIFLNMFIYKNTINYNRNKCLTYLKQEIYNNLLLNVIRKLFYLPYQFFKSKSTGEVESRINDLELFKEFVSNILSTISIDILFIFISSIIILLINKKLFLIILIQMSIYFIYTLAIKNKLNNKTEEVINSNEEYYKCLNETINSYEIDKNLNLTNNSIKRIEFKISNLNNKISNYELFNNKNELFKNMIIDIGYLISIYFSIYLTNKNIITLGEVILFNSIQYYFIEPLKNILNLSYSFSYFKHITYRINDLLMFQIEKEKIINKKIKSNIIINNLSYSIDGVNYIFKNVNLRINYKDKFLIYGDSGNGKSTIMKILLKYIKEYQGNIYFDNYNLKDINSNIISNSFTYVSQNSYITHDTLKNNIIYDRNIKDNKYEEILKICNLLSFRNSKILRDNFIIEDNGFNISGGEKQKIILARSLLKNSNYIILDEALSEVGFDEEKQIIKNIINTFNDKTIIYISHKKEIIDLFSKKYYLERSMAYDEQ